MNKFYKLLFPIFFIILISINISPVFGADMYNGIFSFIAYMKDYLTQDEMKQLLNIRNDLNKLEDASRKISDKYGPLQKPSQTDMDSFRKLERAKEALIKRLEKIMAKARGLLAVAEKKAAEEAAKNAAQEAAKKAVSAARTAKICRFVNGVGKFCDTVALPVGAAESYFTYKNNSAAGLRQMDIDNRKMKEAIKNKNEEEITRLKNKRAKEKQAIIDKYKNDRGLFGSGFTF